MDWYTLGFLPSQLEIETITSPEFQAYNAFRGENTVRATIFEICDQNITIRFDDLGYGPESKMEIHGNNIDIILNNNEYTDLSKAEEWYQGRAISGVADDLLPASFFPVFTDFDIVIAYDLAAILGDAVSIFFPPLTPYGYGVSAVGSVNGLLETWYRYNLGQANGCDLTVSVITTTSGFIPYIGIIPAIIQFLWDIFS
jgi:hypothetical protein